MPSIMLTCTTGENCWLSTNHIVGWAPRPFGAVVKTVNINGRFPAWATRKNGKWFVQETPAQIANLRDEAELNLAAAIEWAMRGPQN